MNRRVFLGTMLTAAGLITNRKLFIAPLEPIEETDHLINRLSLLPKADAKEFKLGIRVGDCMHELVKPSASFKEDFLFQWEFHGFKAAQDIKVNGLYILDSEYFCLYEIFGNCGPIQFSLNRGDQFKFDYKLWYDEWEYLADYQTIQIGNGPKYPANKLCYKFREAK